MQETNTLAEVLFHIAGFALIIIGLKMLSKIWRVKRNGIKVTGTIVEVSEEKGVDEKMYLPVIEYKTVEGEVIRVKRPYDDYRSQKVNTTVKVIYNPLNPREMVEDTFFDKYFVISFLVLLGISFVVMPHIIKSKITHATNEKIRTMP